MVTMRAYNFANRIEGTTMRSREQNTSTGARDHEWAVILAGGDGTRLKSLTRHIAGVRPRWAEAAVPQFS
jgi:hypothetical protein